MTATIKEENGAGNVKGELTAPEDKIAAQIEYYFSDYNLRKDKFMKEKIAEKEGWVNIEVLLTFNRLKALTESVDFIVEALKKTVIGKDDSLLELNEEGTALRRTQPVVDMTEEEIKALNERTIHFKGIPADATLDEIRVFCSQYGKVESVEMRRKRDDSRTFKGCVMCVYATQEDAKRALEGKEVYDPDIAFLRENKVQYFLRKKQWLEDRKKKGKKETAGGDDVKKEETEDDNSDPVKVKDAIIVLEGVDTSTLQYNVVKDYFKQFGDVKYVEMEGESKKAFVRFASSDEAKNALNEKTEVVIKDKTYPVSLLTGDEEIDFWKRVNTAYKNAVPRDNKHRSKGRGFKRGGGGYKGNHDRREYNTRKRAKEGDSNSSAKKVKSESK